MFRTLVLLICLSFVSQAAPASESLSIEILESDPPQRTELAAYDKLYLKVSYESEIPLRFQVSSLRKGAKREFGAMSNSSILRPKGKQNTLVWVSYSNATRIDEVVLTVLDPELQQLGTYSKKVDMSWTSEIVEDQRQPAEWVKALIRKNRLQQEFIFDPTPQGRESLFDALFIFSLATIPIYLFLQVQFLRKWRGRWRHMAVIPIVSVTPLLALPAFGLGLDFRLWIIFIFRGMPLALIFLGCLWLAKWLTGEREAGQG